MSTWTPGPSVFGRPQAVFVRFAPWMTFQNNHPHDLMWPVEMLYARGIAKACGWNAEVVDLHVDGRSREQLIRHLLTLGPDLMIIDTIAIAIRSEPKFASQRLRSLSTAQQIFD